MKDLSDILLHYGEDRQQYFNAVCPPIIQSSNFVFSSIADFRKALESELDQHIYTRGNNPTVQILRKKIAALEGAEDALIFGSGSAAIAAAMIGNLKTGDHVVCVQSPYSWTYNLLTKFLSRFGVSHRFVDGKDMQAIEAAIQENTRILYLESPNTANFDLQDLPACATLANKHGLVTIIDNSYCSPIFQRPIDMGIDLVIHSGTKYLNGHSDVVVGTLAGSRAQIEKIFTSEYMTLGAIISPHDAALVLRGLRTLELRMHRVDKSTKIITDWLSTHPKIERVLYPFHKDFPQVDLARKQMSGCGGLFSILLKAENIEEVETFFGKLNRFTLAVSWGGHESLALPFCAFRKIPGRTDTSVPWNLIRFYIGLEDPDWLLEDLRQALGSFELGS